MTKDKTTRNLKVLSGALVLFTACMVALILLLKNLRTETTSSVTLEVNKVETKTLSFNSMSLKPGDVEDFSINFKSSLASTYEIGLDFVELNSSGLNDFINVSISYKEFNYNDTLTNLFDKDTKVKFDCVFNEASTEKVNISYIMPNEVGNEAQGTGVDFNIVVSISQK